jgi:2-haloacid dehalogenase
MLGSAVEASGLGDLLDALLSVDAVHAYKPRPEVYALVTQQFGLVPSEVVFVSSNRWDVMGAASFGFATIWVNRARVPDEYPDWPPGRVVSSLAELPSLAT